MMLLLLLLCGLVSCAHPAWIGGGERGGGERGGERGDHGHSSEEHGGPQYQGSKALESLLKALSKANNGSLSPEGIVAFFSKCNLSGIDFPHPAQPINLTFADVIGQPPYSVPNIIAKLQQILNITHEQIVSKGAEIYARCKDVLPPPSGDVDHDIPKFPRGFKPGPDRKPRSAHGNVKPVPKSNPTQSPKQEESHKSPEPEFQKSSKPGSYKSPESEFPKSPKPESHKSPKQEPPKKQKPGSPRG